MQTLLNWRICCVLALPLWGCAVPTVAPTTPDAIEHPIQMLDAAARSLGSAVDRRAALSLYVEQAGTSFPTEQARDPVTPIGQAERLYRWHHDGDRLLREAEQLFPGGIRFRTRALLTPTGGWNVDLVRWRTGTDLLTINPDVAQRQRLQWQRYFPHLVIAQADAARNTLESAGDYGFRYRDAIGDMIEVDLDPVSFRPRRVVQAGEGQGQGELAYSDYERRHGVMLPGNVELSFGGRLQEAIRLGASRISPLQEPSLQPPAGYALPPASGPPLAREIAPGVFYFDNMPGDYHSVALDLGDHLVLVESPLSPAYAQIQREILDEILPGKPVRDVVVTHHHGDHNGGLASWVEGGAGLIVPEGAAVAIKRQLLARGYSGKTSIREVSGRQSFGMGRARFDAHVFSSSHAAANLFVYLPEARLLYQGDLFYLPERGLPPPAFPVVAELQGQIEARRLSVDHIAGTHGRVGTLLELHESIKAGLGSSN